jgi:hypothetical protein
MLGAPATLLRRADVRLERKKLDVDGHQAPPL